MSETLRLRQSNLESVNCLYQSLKRDSDLMQQDSVPKSVLDKVVDINRDWVVVRELCGQHDTTVVVTPAGGSSQGGVAAGIGSQCLKYNSN